MKYEVQNFVIRVSAHSGGLSCELPKEIAERALNEKGTKLVLVLATQREKRMVALAKRYAYLSNCELDELVSIIEQADKSAE